MTRSYITLGTVIRWFAIALTIGLFVLYVLWQSRIFITGPVITITTTPSATTTAATVTVAGRADNIVWIKLNDRSIVTTPEGEFKETVTLSKGYTIITLSAADRFGRIEERHFPVVQLSTSTMTRRTETDIH